MNGKGEKLASAIRARAQLVRLGKTPKAMGHNHLTNTLQLSEGHGGCYKHNLTDYRNENRVLAVSILQIKDAYELNQRLAGTGLGFNRVTGY